YGTEAGLRNARALTLGIEVPDVLIHHDAGKVVRLERCQECAHAAGGVGERDARTDLVHQLRCRIRLQLRVLDRVELEIAGTRGLIPRLGILRRELHALEPVRILRAESPCGEVFLAATDPRLVPPGLTPQMGAPPLRPTQDERGKPATKKDA